MPLDYSSCAEKRQHSRQRLLTAAKADFISPPEVFVLDLSPGGIGLGGIEHIGPRTGVVEFNIPGTQVVTSAVCTVCWSHSGSAGLKFVTVKTSSRELEAWFASTAPPPPVSPDAARLSRLPGPSNLTGQYFDELRQASWPSSAAEQPLRTLLRQATKLWLAVIAVSALALIYWQDSALRTIRSRMATPLGAVEAATSPAPALPPGMMATVTTIEGTPIYRTRPKLNSIVPAVQPATMVAREAPGFPASAAVAGIQGDVEAILSIDENGVVDAVRITRGDPVLAREVTATLSHWRYKPFVFASTTVAVELPITVQFRIASRAAGPAGELPAGSQ